MADLQPTDSHDSNSMARPVSSASVDGWDVESSSADQPSSEQLAARLRDEPDPPKAEAAAAETDDDLDDAPDRETPAGEPEHPKKKKLTASERKAVLQAEFNAITRQREDARRAFEAEEADRERKRYARPAPEKADEKVPDSPAEAAKLDLAEGQPDWDEYEARGETFSKYQKDLSAFYKAESVKEARREATSVVTSLLSKAKEQDLAAAEEAREESRRQSAIQKYPDWEEKIAANLADVPQTPFMTTVVRRHEAGMELLYQLAEHPAEAKILATLPMTRPIIDAVREAPDPAPLLLYFARNPEEHSRIAHLDPPRQLLALGRLVAHLSDEGAKNGSPSPTPPVTSARPPIRPVGATRSAGGARGDDDDIEFGPEYVRRQNEARLARAHR